jgi:hypothetical protein
MPNPFRLAVIANVHFDDVRLPLIPHALQKLALALGAPVGRLLGYGPTNSYTQENTLVELPAAA